MATDGVNIAEDAEMAECDGDKVVTMMDVLQEQQDFEEDANAVLGASDDKNCTYSKGYIKRQALYACLTCCTEAKADPTKRAGVCLACSLNCHENHELIELYTKRNFRCDCGNPKFNSHPCQFTTDKTGLNDENIYNQNFSGLYCTCQRPYPDPDSTIEDDMIQCIICEDWLHSSHLETVVPANDQYAEMVCKSCMEKNEFLHDYSLFAINVEAGDVLEIDVLDITAVNGDGKSADNSLCNGSLEKEKLEGEDNNTEIDGANVTVNGDVEMNDDKQESEDKKIDGSESKIDESIETKQDDSKKVLTTESIPEENEKSDNIDLGTKSDKEERTMETSETNEPAQTDDTLAIPKDSNIGKENAETSQDTQAQSKHKSDAAEITSEVEPKQKHKTSTDDQTVTTDQKIDTTDDKMETTDIEPEKTDEASKEQSETQDIEPTKVESGNSNNLHENITDTGEKTEQQLLDELSALTADNQTLEEKKDEPVVEKSEESTEQSDEIKKTEDVQTNNEALPKETSTESGDSSEEKLISDTQKDTGIIEVPDTSQSEPNEKENANDKSDSVMDAIDELLQTANEAKEIETLEEKKESISESIESKENTENVETKESTDVEMSASENKLDIEAPEKAGDTTETNDKTSTTNDTEDVEMSASENKLDIEAPEKAGDTTETNDKTSTTNDTEAVEMSDTTTEKDTPVNESKDDDSPAIDTESKDVNDTEASDSTKKTETSIINENKIDDESPKDMDEKSKVADTVNEDIIKENDALNETENELLRATDENDSTNKNESSTDDTVNKDISKDENEALTETENELLRTTDENDTANKNEPSTDDNKITDVTENTKEHKRKLSTDSTEDISPKKTKLECTRPREVKRVHKGATFWPSNFRQKLCTCGECLSMYKDLKVLFLTDLEDTVFAYESLGKENVAGGASQYEKGMQALSSLDRIQQINALTEYNKMRDKLLDFLKSFKDRKEVVKEEDIKAFFAGMKPRREPDGVYFCR